MMNMFTESRMNFQKAEFPDLEKGDGNCIIFFITSAGSSAKVHTGSFALCKMMSAQLVARGAPLPALPPQLAAHHPNDFWFYRLTDDQKWTDLRLCNA